MNKKIIKNENCILEIEGKEKFNLKIKDKEILNFNFYLKTTSFISKEEAKELKELLEFNKNLSKNFPEIKIYSENDFLIIKFLNYEIFFSEVVILTKLKNETFHITFSEKIEEKNLPKLNNRFKANDFTVSFGKYWIETDLDVRNPSFSYEIGCEEKFKFYLNQMSYKTLSSPKFKTFVRMIELSYKYINMEEFFKKYFSIN